MYEYRARIVRVIDGDTVEAEIDLGFHVRFTVTLRLAGINAPETKGTERPRGLAATRYLERLLNEWTGASRELLVRTHKDVTEKYGRYLAELIAGEVNLNQALVAAGHAVPAQY
jgi:micrococcal nuclease